MIGAVLFDMDGVLVESYEVWFPLVNAAALELGYPAVDRASFEQAWGQGVREDVEKFFPNHTVDAIERYYTEHFSDHGAHLEVNADAREVIDSLRGRDVPMAVVTNTPGELAREILAYAGLSIETLVGGTDVAAAKPAADMVERACELLGVAVTEAVLVGDSSFDREAARRAGCRFLGYRLDGGERRLESLREVLELLDGEGPGEGGTP